MDSNSKSKIFHIVYGKSENRIHEYDEFNYEQKINQKNTIRDVKEYVKEQRYKKHELVCTCQLMVGGIVAPKSLTFYNDDTYLDILDERIPIFVFRIREQCTCGQLEKLLISSSNYEMKREEDKKKWEEKERSHQ